MNISDIDMDTHFAFQWTWNGEEDEIIVAKPTMIYDDCVLVHFLHGHHSIGEHVRYEDILAIGDAENGTHGIKGWSGRYRLIQPEHKLLKTQLK